MNEDTKKADPVLEALRVELRGLLDADLDARTLNRIAQVSTAASNLLAARNPKEHLRRGRLAAGITTIANPIYSMGSMGSNLGYDAPLPEGMEDGDESEGSLSPAPPNETYASRLIREMVSTLPALLTAHRDTPEALVSAIASARRSGMIDVAVLLEQRLGLKLAADAQRPVRAAPPDIPPTVEEYLATVAGGAAGVAAGALASEGA